jgi:hypothetical protein
MSLLQISLFGPYFNSFSTNSYGYYSQMSGNLVSNTQIFASALIIRRAARSIYRKGACHITSTAIKEEGIIETDYFSPLISIPA